MNQNNNQRIPKFEFMSSNYNMLILDDSNSINNTLTKIFSNEGYNCFSAFTIKDAKEILANNQIHYVMLDINLPDGNGYELITLLEKSSVKIFVLTTEKDKQFREISYQKGIIDFILKDKNFFHKVDQITKTIENIEKNKINRVLVIDDSIVIQEQLKDLLENRHYTVEIASDIQTAEKILGEVSIDLILLDLVLKNENGIDFLQKNNNEIINIKKIPVLVVSGNVNSSTIRDSIKAGAVDVLSKPYIFEEIVLKVDLWTDYKRKENEIIINTKNLEVKNKLLEEQKITIEELLIQQSKMASMGEMLENIIHQWKQPLSVISTTVSSVQLQKELNILDDESLDKSFVDILDVIDHLADTLDDFREYLQPNRKRETFKLDESVNKSVSLLMPQFKNENIKIIKNDSNFSAFGFQNDFIQSFLNILNNAKDALKETTKQKRLIFIDFKMINDTEVEIIVKDSAGGIPENIIDKIFESRFTTKNQSDGTGIGLYMTKEMVEKHMLGKLAVRNQVYKFEDVLYKGAEFTITLPSN